MKENKNKHAVAMGKIGGKNRAKNLSPERRSAIAKMGAKARWLDNKHKTIPNVNMLDIKQEKE
jgi:hypothetical protein